MPHHNWKPHEDERPRQLIDEGLTASKIRAHEERFWDITTSALQSRIRKVKREM